MTKNITIAYSPTYLKWRGSHASPQRARIALSAIKARCEDFGVAVEVIQPQFEESISTALTLVHSKQYVQNVLAGRTNEWKGTSTEQARTAAVMFQGTRVLVEQIIADDFESKVYFNPQGAKHHAGYNQSSGFCVFNDMAWAAKTFTDMGLKVAYLDWDVHHGDGVEALTLNNPDVLTISIHQFGIFPGTGLKCNWRKNVLNFPMYAGDGDAELSETIDIAIEAMRDFEPNVILLACGADGLAGDPLGSLEYTIDGLTAAAAEVGTLARELNVPVLVGGAGGYQPFTLTPIAWAETVWAIHQELIRPVRQPEIDSIEGLEALLSQRGVAEAVAADAEEDLRLDDDESTETDRSRDRVRQIMASLDGFEPDVWAELLTTDEYDVVQHIIEPIITRYIEKQETKEKQTRKQKKESKRSDAAPF